MEIEKIEDLSEEIKNQILDQISLSEEICDDKILAMIDQRILEETRSHYLSLKEKMELRSEVFNAIRKMDVLSELLDDEDVTEIMINGPDKIFVEKRGRLFRTEKSFGDEKKLLRIVQQIVSDANRVVNDTKPIADAILKDGSRVNIVLSGISKTGTAVTIRKFPKRVITMKDLIELHSLDEKTALFLEMLVTAGYNIFISGGTGSGKTTFVNALTEFIPKGDRVITIEDSAELRPIGVENLVALEQRNANCEEQHGVSIRDLIKTSLRMRPERIIVGEVRGEEALDMLQAMNTGHDGSLSTGHANSAREMLMRIESMCLMGATNMPLAAIRAQISGALDIIVHLGRLRDGTRRVLEITEVIGMENGEIKTKELFKFEEKGEEMGKVKGDLQKINDLKNLGKLMSAGTIHVFKERFA